MYLERGEQTGCGGILPRSTMGKDRVRLRYWAVLVVPLLLAFLSPDLATAQQGAVENVPDTPRRSQRELEDAAKAAERARIQRLLDGGGEVTY